MRLVLVRHGQTSCNVENIWHGWDHCELTEEGQAQAGAVAARLAGEPIAGVYSSDSRRALQTAAAIAAPHGLQPVPDAGLRERHAGAFEGLTISDIESRHPTVWQDRDADLWGWGPPGGEAMRTVLDRGLAVIHRLAECHPRDTVVVVSHMTMVRALISRLGHIPLKETYTQPFPSTGVTIITIEGDETRLEVLNDASHVDDATIVADGASSPGSL
jgi:broad specificity phosphatase PhoE